MLWLVKPAWHIQSNMEALIECSSAVIDFDAATDLSEEFNHTLLRINLRSKPAINGPTADMLANQLLEFVQRVDVDDLILQPDRTASSVLIGRVVADYCYAEDAGPGLKHQRPVRWSNQRIDLGELAESIFQEINDYSWLLPANNERFVLGVWQKFKDALEAKRARTTQIDSKILAGLETEMLRLQQRAVRVQHYSSDELHHFVGRSIRLNLNEGYDRLCSILRSGHLTPDPSRPEPHPQSFQYNLDGSIIAETFLKPACVCFCDIPADDIDLHITKYGRFGLSFAKTYATQLGARPVFYVPCTPSDWRGLEGRTLLNRLQEVYGKVLNIYERSRAVGVQVSSADAENIQVVSDVLHVLSRDVISFVKAFNLHRPDTDERQYYLEREWRLLGSMRFEQGDVRRIFLPEGYAARFRSDFPEYLMQVTFV